MKEKFYKAWNYLENNHDWFPNHLNIIVVKVHPKLKTIVNDESKNTIINYWLETGPFAKKENCWTHDINLDCGGDSFEEAIIQLAKLIKKQYPKPTNLFGTPKPHNGNLCCKHCTPIEAYHCPQPNINNKTTMTKSERREKTRKNNRKMIVSNRSIKTIARIQINKATK